MAIARYQKKISGPLMDRIDIHVEVPRVDYEKLADKRQMGDSNQFLELIVEKEMSSCANFLHELTDAIVGGVPSLYPVLLLSGVGKVVRYNVCRHQQLLR